MVKSVPLNHANFIPAKDVAHAVAFVATVRCALMVN
jgi:hypothetical protein